MTLFRKLFGHERDSKGMVVDYLAFGCVAVGGFFKEPACLTSDTDTSKNE
jgi:hypothetical protein